MIKYLSYNRLIYYLASLIAYDADDFTLAACKVGLVCSIVRVNVVATLLDCCVHALVVAVVLVVEMYVVSVICLYDLIV